MSRLKFILTFVVSLSLLSCGQSKEVTIDNAILSAQIELSNGNCGEAIKILELLGRENTNADYLRTLASGYACRAGYSTANFFTNDLTSMTGVILTDVASFSTSNEGQLSKIQKEQTFIDMQTAIDLLLYAGGLSTYVNPSASLRAAKFSSVEAADIESYLMYLLMAQLGKYMHFYGNTDTAGLKGGGNAASSNVCIGNYDNIANDANDTNTDTLLLAGGASCTDATDIGSTFIDDGSGDNDLAIMCQGVTLMNNFFDVFPSVIGSISGADFSGLSGIATIVDTAKSAITTFRATSAAAIGYTSEERCVTNESTDTNMQVYFVIMFETLLQ